MNHRISRREFCSAGAATAAALAFPLPAFAQATRNSRLTAIVSGDRRKRQEIGKKYRLDKRYSYDEYDACLADVDQPLLGALVTLEADVVLHDRLVDAAQDVADQQVGTVRHRLLLGRWRWDGALAA